MTQGYSQKILDLSKFYKTNNLVSSTKICKKKEKERVGGMTYSLKENKQNIKQLNCAMWRFYLASELSKVKPHVENNQINVTIDFIFDIK